MSEFLQQTINGIAWGSIYALIALGYTMVYGVLRLINFAHGDVYMIGAMTGYYAAQLMMRYVGKTSFPLVLLAAMAVCALLGFLIERIAYRPLRKSPRITALITAIGISLFLEYTGQFVFGADPKFFPSLIQDSTLFQWQGVVIQKIQVIIFSVSLGLMLAIGLIIKKTRLGKAMRAVSFSHTASQLVGINLNGVISFTFILGSALAGAGAILVGLANPKVDPLMGIMPGVKAFVAAVLGGIGNIPGAWAGGILMGVSETFVVGYISSTYRDALAFILLIVILLVKPTGLFGKSVSEKV
jgi:branched-chain amino acid transport system permease protein